MANTNYQPKVYREQGGNRQVVASGGALDVESGGELDIESGGALKLAGTQVTATAAELNKLDDSAVTLTKGTGFALATAHKSGVFKNGDLIVTRILLDIEALNEGGTAGDIIGDNGQANAHFGQITAALNGTIIAGTMTCLELPTGGTVDIDLYSAAEGTGSEDAAISGLTETQLLNSGNWTLGLSQPLTALPAANQYLYLVGQGTGNTAYTAGKFLLELYGY